MSKLTGMRRWTLAVGIAAAMSPAAADEVSGPTPIALPGDAQGAPRDRTQQMYDPVARTLVRRWVRVWDQRPDQGRIFTWTPDRIPPAGGLAGGRGRLTWRDAGAPSYDPDAVASAYRGTMRDGRPDGAGTEVDRDGTRYDGQWRAGRPEGRGRLRLPDGAEYDGAFRAGEAEGPGRLVDIDGEAFEGEFRHGLREGLGTTTLPNRARYRSRWHAGAEDPASRKVRLAQAGGGAAALDQDVRLGVSVVQRPAHASFLQYTSVNSAEFLRVMPDNEHLMSVWKGNGELQTDRTVNLDRRYTGYLNGIFDIDRTGISPLQFAMNVQNKGGQLLQIVGAFLQVSLSSTDYQPAVQLSISEGDGCGVITSFSPTFELQNLGWGPVEHPVIHYTFVKDEASVPVGLQQSKQINSFSSSRVVDFEADFRSAGMRTDSLKQFAAAKLHLPCTAASPADCLDRLRSTGLFGRLAKDVYLVDNTKVMVAVKGELAYEWRDSSGSFHKRESPFRSRFLLGTLPETAECGEGGENIPVAVNPVELQLDRTNYRIPLSFEQTLPPGRTARYSFALTAAKASQHRFTVVLQLADGREIASRPVDLTYFVPNWTLSN